MCQATGVLAFVFPGAVQHLHPADKTGVAALGLCKDVFDPAGFAIG